MHRLTLEEIKKQCAGEPMPLLKPEQTVILEPCGKGGCERKGRFDFLLETKDHETIGFEVLTRPSKGKLKKKLSYAREVQSFVFVMPEGFLNAYRKKQKRPFERIERGREFPPEFGSESLKAWLLDLKAKSFTEKNSFRKVFNVMAD